MFTGITPINMKILIDLLGRPLSPMSSLVITGLVVLFLLTSLFSRLTICRRGDQGGFIPFLACFGALMEVFCFPDPEDPDPQQVRLPIDCSISFTSYGATENELQAIYIKMHDWERLLLVRRTIEQLELL